MRRQNRRIEILFSDRHIAAIGKPEGIPSVPIPNSKVRSAQDILESIMRKDGSYSAGHRPFAVHRLDRDTSGVMLFALSSQAQKKIMDSWQSMVRSRVYRAVAENPRKFTLAESGTIDSPLALNAYHQAYVPKSGGTISAITHYKILLRGRTHSLFELELETGRKNQIRAHLASKGFPLAGDKNYRARTNPFGRLALHARSIAFAHPYTGEEMEFLVPEPAGWERFVADGQDLPSSVAGA